MNIAMRPCQSARQCGSIRQTNKNHFEDFTFLDYCKATKKVGPSKNNSSRWKRLMIYWALG